MLGSDERQHGLLRPLPEDRGTYMKVALCVNHRFDGVNRAGVPIMCAWARALSVRV
jgi:hypothetical protein